MGETCRLILHDTTSRCSESLLCLISSTFRGRLELLLFAYKLGAVNKIGAVNKVGAVKKTGAVNKIGAVNTIRSCEQNRDEIGAVKKLGL